MSAFKELALLEMFRADRHSDLDFLDNHGDLIAGHATAYSSL